MYSININIRKILKRWEDFESIIKLLEDMFNKKKGRFIMIYEINRPTTLKTY